MLFYVSCIMLGLKGMCLYISYNLFKTDIFLQETHTVSNDENVWIKNFGICYKLCQDYSNRKGVAIFSKHRL